MKQFITILFSLLVITSFSQDITNTLGTSAGDGSHPSFRVNNSNGDSVFVIRGNGSIIGLGSMRMPIKIISGDYPVVAGDFTLLCDATASPMEVTFPLGLQTSGAIIFIKKFDTGPNDVTLTDTDGNWVTLDSKGDGATLQYYNEGGSQGWAVIATAGNGIKESGGTSF